MNTKFFKQLQRDRERLENKLKAQDEGWIITDPSCNQMRRKISPFTYEFKEDRITNPETKDVELYHSVMDYNDYTIDEIVDACMAFGYSYTEIISWIQKDQNIELMLECLFELET
ncbi:MAG: hypothetical protein ACOCWC_04910 [Bacteroidota bacterium]